MELEYCSDLATNEPFPGVRSVGARERTAPSAWLHDHTTIKLRLCVLNRDKFGKIVAKSLGDAPSHVASVAA